LLAYFNPRLVTCLRFVPAAVDDTLKHVGLVSRGTPLAVDCVSRLIVAV